ncbi:MAG: hypothetical protein EP346_00095, partial [Bacteroidetes bacterium]
MDNQIYLAILGSSAVTLLLGKAVDFLTQKATFNRNSKREYFQERMEFTKQAFKVLAHVQGSLFNQRMAMKEMLDSNRKDSELVNYLMESSNVLSDSINQSDWLELNLIEFYYDRDPTSLSRVLEEYLRCFTDYEVAFKNEEK